MFNKNLKYYRLKNQLTMKELANRAGITLMAISNYESGKRVPKDINILKRIADVLGVRVLDLLSYRDENLLFCHGDFRKHSVLSESQQDFIRESVEEYFGRFMSIVDILDDEALPDSPKLHSLDITGDIEQDALSLRRHMNLAEYGPIKNIVDIIENQGILVYMCDVNNNHFFGMNGTVNGRPYIVINKNMTTERIRSTIVHELAHLMFKWPSDCMDDVEKMATAISGAFLFTGIDAIRELGYKRKVIYSKDVILVAEEYGISMLMIVKRARILKIISSYVEKDFYIKANSLGWRKNEPSRIPNETPKLFEQLVYRAINENEISIQKGAELLKISYDEIANSINGE